MVQRILRPMSYGDIFDELFDLYKKHFTLFVGISAVVHVPLNAIAYAIGGTAAPIIIAIVGLIVTYVVLAATTWAVSQCYLGNKTSIADSYKAIGRTAVPFAITMIMVGLRIFGAFFLLIVPGVILAFRYAFVSEVYILEGKRGKDARTKSALLAKGNEGRIFVLGFLSSILVMIINAVITFPLGMVAGAIGGPTMMMGGPAGLLYGVMTGISNALTSPLQVMAFVLLYYDIRVRKEGFDIEMLASNMGMFTQEAAPVLADDHAKPV